MNRHFARTTHRMDEEEGFTLIELMVVVLIIGILIAIAVPTFLGARARAENRAAEANLRNALTAAKTYMTDGDTYTGFDVSAAKAVEPSINWVPTSVSSSPSNSVGLATATDGDTVYLEAQSGTGNCYEIVDKVSGGNIGTYYRMTTGATGACTVDTTAPTSSSATNPVLAGW